MPIAVETSRKPLSSVRSQAPVFVMGCHRSGTNLLYDTLLSAGGFAVYRGYLPIYKMLIPRYGELSKLSSRKKILDVFLRSKGFRRSGLETAFVRDKVLNECHNGGDFIRITMDEITRRQQATRWAFYDPDAVLQIPVIKAEIPEAIFVHILRDGRDIALSLRKMGGFRPFPWHRRQLGLLETGLYWEWMVRRGRSYGSQIPADYIEIHYEELVTEPYRVLKKLGTFIDHDLDYRRIQQAGLGRVRESNSSFLEDPEEVQGNPVNRWKEMLTPDEIAQLEATIGDTLREFGYETSASHARPTLKHRSMRSAYRTMLDAKLFLKTRTPLGRFSDLSALELDSPE